MADDLTYVRYARRASQGQVLGIDRVGMASIGAVAIPTMLTVLVADFFTAIPVAVVLSPLGLAGVIKRHGMSLMVWLLWAAQWRVRKMMGLTKYRRKIDPIEPLVHGELELPGLGGRFQVWEAPSGTAVIWDKVRQTASVTCMVASPGMARHRTQVTTPREREELIASLMRVAGSWTRRRQIARVSMQERTRPGTVVRERREFERLGVFGPIAESYLEVLDRAEAETVLHPQAITITLDAKGGAGRASVKALGGGKAGVLAMVDQEINASTESLKSGGFTKVAWCTPREWAAWGRSIVDPVSEIKLDARIGGAFEGIAPELAGPMVCDDGKHHVETDSALHRAYWISEFPRLETLPGFMGEVASATTSLGLPVRHTLHIVGKPVPLEEALKGIRKSRETWKQNANLRASRGRDVTIADNADWQNLDQREQDLINGQGEFAWTGYLVVSALSEDALAQSCTAMELAGSSASIELVELTHQQAATLMMVAYPVGTGI